MFLNKTIILSIITMVLFLAAYLPIITTLVNVWQASEEYSHAFLTIPIVGFMAWCKREKLLKMQVRYAPLGLIVVGLSMPLYMFGLVANVRTIIAIGMLISVVGTIIYLFGIGSIKELFIPLILLVMLIPIPDQLYIKLTFPLQLNVSQASEVIIRMIGIPLLREGNVMHIPQKSFEVVEACSGLRSAISLTTLSIIMGYFFLRSIAARIILVAVCIPIAVFVNIVRLVSIILVFHFFGIDLAKGTMHTVTGIFVFLLAFLSLILCQRVLERWETKQN